MARNVEIKAALQDRAVVEARAVQLDGATVEELAQTDVYFRVPRGRLKLRIFGASAGSDLPEAPPAELIQYQRPDGLDPEVSSYQRVAVPQPTELRAALSAALGERVVVKKRRTVYLVGRTRIHLDRVDGLGDFLELEVVLRGDEDQRVGEQEARSWMQRLGIAAGDLIEAGYADLLEASTDGACTSSTSF